MIMAKQSSRREVFADLKLPQASLPHPGLWLDKFLEAQSSQGDENTYAPHFQEVVRLTVSPTYGIFFESWRDALTHAGTVMFEAKALGRLAVGLGAESVLENNLSIHRTYGVPYIPGSALKGLAARYARQRLEDEAWHTEVNQRGDIIRRGEAYRVLFGDTAEAGYVTFFDALYVPNSAPQNRPLVLDVITVHHPKYYQGESAPPADWDSPTPVPFLSARGSYLIALFGPDAWVDVAFQILARALREEGIGAKTNSGYGRMMLEGVTLDETDVSSPSTPTLDPDEATIQRFQQRLDAMASKDVAGQIHAVYQDWKRLTDVTEAGKLTIAQLILNKLESSGQAKKLRKRKKTWFIQLTKYVETPPSQGDTS